MDTSLNKPQNKQELIIFGSGGNVCAIEEPL
jgi:hypothetical protein